MDTFGGTCWSNSFILGTRLTGVDRNPLLFEATGGGRPTGFTKGGAARIEVNEGAEAASDEIVALVVVAIIFGFACCCFALL